MSQSLTQCGGAYSHRERGVQNNNNCKFWRKKKRRPDNSTFTTGSKNTCSKRRLLKWQVFVLPVPMCACLFFFCFFFALKYPYLFPHSRTRVLFRITLPKVGKKKKTNNPRFGKRGAGEGEKESWRPLVVLVHARIRCLCPMCWKQNTARATIEGAKKIAILLLEHPL